jgi:dTDP-4-dehydrorhamnose reductase
MRLLVLGGNGQVGHELRRALAPLGEVVATTRSGRCLTAALRTGGFRCTGNAAGLSSDRPGHRDQRGGLYRRGQGETDIEAAFRANAEAPGLWQACAAARCPLFDRLRVRRAGHAPCREDDPVAPLGVYGASKRAGEVASMPAAGT